ncbi:MAG TPA: hypothetical protein VM914_11980 [Pyrinomonadaceae bacterium]|jgi:hypothetical protein|nr:hypothetical protein [Pyrinomonadaceae bacterium]
MYFRLKALAFALLLSQFAFASTARAQQTTTPPRRPSGPAAGPVIKLPRDGNASLDPTQSDSKGRAERAAEPKRWEYCAVVGFNYRQKNFPSNSHTPSAVIRFFPDTLEEVEGATEEGALANAFTRLGDDGWELTGITTNFSLTDGNGKTSSVYYFKRPKRPQQD